MGCNKLDCYKNNDLENNTTKITIMLTSADISRLAAKVAEQVLQKSDELMTPKQAAEYLGISLNALQQRRTKTQIPSHKKDGCVYYSKRELTEYYLSL